MPLLSEVNGHAPYRLTEEIVARSIAGTWHAARHEWVLSRVFFADRGQTGNCLCGHVIREHCVLLNRLNGNEVVVGNCCVKRFLQRLESEPVFAGLRRIARDVERALNPAAVEHAHARGWLTDWERRFLLDTCRKRRPSPKQLAKRAEINSQILQRVSKPKEVCHA